VIQPYISLTTDADFAHKKFATPQWGNTQDIALKHYLLLRGHTTLDKGGDVDIITPGNAGILSQFQLNRIDGAWVPEPGRPDLSGRREGGCSSTNGPYGRMASLSRRSS